jgi:hypothetical protein
MVPQFFFSEAIFPQVLSAHIDELSHAPRSLESGGRIAFPQTNCRPDSTPMLVKYRSQNDLRCEKISEVPTFNLPTSASPQSLQMSM